MLAPLAAGSESRRLTPNYRLRSGRSRWSRAVLDASPLLALWARVSWLELA